MVMHTSTSLTLQRPWLPVMVVVVATLVGLGVQRAEGGVIDDECLNVIGNREIYKKVTWICDDCANIFRENGLGALCKRNCFLNTDFLWCVHASERQGDLDQYKRWVSILGAGRE